MLPTADPARPEVRRLATLATDAEHDLAVLKMSGAPLPALPLRDFTVSLHWSRRFESDPGNQWMRGLIEQLFKE